MQKKVNNGNAKQIPYISNTHNKIYLDIIIVFTFFKLDSAIFMVLNKTTNA